MTIHEAVAALRKHFGDTHQAFATRFGLSMGGVQNYQKARVPEPGPLYLFMLAAGSERPDLAEIFRAEWYRQLRLPDSWEGVAPFEPKGDFEKAYVAGLLLCLRNPQITEGRAAVFESLQTWTERAMGAIRNAQVKRKVLRELRAGFKKAADAGHGEWDEEKGRYTLYRKDQPPADWDVTLGSDKPAIAQIEALMKEAKAAKEAKPHKASGSGNR